MSKYTPGEVPPVEAQVPPKTEVDQKWLGRDLSLYTARVDSIVKKLAVSLEDAEGLYNAGTVYMRLHLLDKAMEMMDRAIEKDPNYGYAYNLKGVIYTWQRDYDRALENYRRALEFFPEDAGIRLNISLTYYLMGRRAEAEKEYQQAVQIDPDLEGTLEQFQQPQRAPAEQK